jgi:hypothetical protein
MECRAVDWNRWTGQDKRANKHPDMVVNRHKYFRWTRRTAFLATMYVVVVPATLGYFGYITDVSCDDGSGVVLGRGDAGLMWAFRASGICVVRGGEIPSLSFREWERGCEEGGRGELLAYISYGNAGSERCWTIDFPCVSFICAPIVSSSLLRCVVLVLPEWLYGKPRSISLRQDTAACR